MFWKLQTKSGTQCGLGIMGNILSDVVEEKASFFVVEMLLKVLAK